jgi:hypothetical protein
VNPGLRAQVLAAAAAEAAPTRAAVTRRNLWFGTLGALSGIGALLIFAVFMSDGRLLNIGGEIAPQQRVERSVWLVVATAGGALSVAAAALWLALARGRSMLGRSRPWLLYGGVLIPISLFVWKESCSMAFADPMVPWPQRLGLRCLVLSLFVALGPLLSFLAIRRHAPAQPALNGAVMGFAAGAVAWIAVDLWCPVAYVPHVLLGHVLPLFVLAGAGALLGQMLLSLRRR